MTQGSNKINKSKKKKKSTTPSTRKKKVNSKPMTLNAKLNYNSANDNRRIRSTSAVNKKTANQSFSNLTSLNKNVISPMRSIAHHRTLASPITSNDNTLSIAKASMNYSQHTSSSRIRATSNKAIRL